MWKNNLSSWLLTALTTLFSNAFSLSLSLSLSLFLSLLKQTSDSNHRPVSPFVATRWLALHVYINSFLPLLLLLFFWAFCVTTFNGKQNRTTVCVTLVIWRRRRLCEGDTQNTTTHLLQSVSVCMVCTGVCRMCSVVSLIRFCCCLSAELQRSSTVWLPMPSLPILWPYDCRCWLQGQVVCVVKSKKTKKRKK